MGANRPALQKLSSVLCHWIYLQRISWMKSSRTFSHIIYPEGKIFCMIEMMSRIWFLIILVSVIRIWECTLSGDVPSVQAGAVCVSVAVPELRTDLGRCQSADGRLWPGWSLQPGVMSVLVLTEFQLYLHLYQYLHTEQKPTNWSFKNTFLKDLFCRKCWQLQ